MNAQDRHAILLLAAIRADAISRRMDDQHFRQYVVDLTDSLDLPDPKRLVVLPGGDEAA